MEAATKTQQACRIPLRITSPLTYSKIPPRAISESCQSVGRANSPKVGHIRAKLGRHRPKSVKVGRSRPWPTLAKSASDTGTFIETGASASSQTGGEYFLSKFLSSSTQSPAPPHRVLSHQGRGGVCTESWPASAHGTAAETMARRYVFGPQGGGRAVQIASVPTLHSAEKPAGAPRALSAPPAVLRALSNNTLRRARAREQANATRGREGTRPRPGVCGDAGRRKAAQGRARRRKGERSGGRRGGG